MQSIEVLGLPETQEKAIKSTVKEIVYDKWDHFRDGLWRMIDKNEFCDAHKSSLQEFCEECPYYKNNPDMKIGELPPAAL